MRNELKFAKKIFFWDNGIRNAIINNFNPLAMRNDAGSLWENFMISERMKRNNYHHPYTKGYFWRTVSQQEIDYIEENNNEITAFELKWNEKKKAKKVSSFSASYQKEIKTINPSNFREFLIHYPSLP
jgi:predicted AAA+ superfamily ATPase